MTSETAVIIAALGGAAIGGAITLATNWINKRSEERKQLNSLFVNAGIENWKQGIAHAQTLKKSQEFSCVTFGRPAR
ncbi:MAG: hypothetical protein SCABRO_01792, partial [Candidatus Scalindua brodae]